MSNTATEPPRSPFTAALVVSLVAALAAAVVAGAGNAGIAFLLVAVAGVVGLYAIVGAAVVGALAHMDKVHVWRELRLEQEGR